MMPHPKPEFNYKFCLEKEVENLIKHKQLRRIPEKSSDKLLVATWNLTNFGVQKRGDDHIRLMAEIIRFFDLTAIQEVDDNLSDFEKLLDFLGSGWNAIYTDPAGNQERLAFIIEEEKVAQKGLVAELAMRGYERRRITIQIEDVSEEATFEGFNRNPYIATFTAGKLEFTLVNVHLYWANSFMRELEAKALSKWAKQRVDKPYPPNNDIILVGDFNMARLQPEDPIYNELTRHGLKLPKHETGYVGTNLAGDKHYDELAFFPSKTEEDFTGRMGVFDFDNAILTNLWDDNDRKRQKMFFQYIRYFIADHRPLWFQLSI